MKIIGLTGQSGAGKSTAGEILRAAGIPVLDADEIYRSLTVPGSPLLSELRAAFGDGVISGDGSLDRKALSARVFTDPEARRRLNEITHRAVTAIMDTVLSELEKSGTPLAAVDAPQLFEAGYDRRCDDIIAVVAPKEQLLSRILARDGISRQAAEARLSAQYDESFFRENCTYVIENSGTRRLLQARIRDVLSKIREGEKT